MCAKKVVFLAAALVSVCHGFYLFQSDPHGVPLFFRDRSRFAQRQDVLEARNDDDGIALDDEVNELGTRLVKVPLISVEDITRNLTGANSKEVIEEIATTTVISELRQQIVDIADPADAPEPIEESDSDSESSSDSDDASDSDSESDSLEDFRSLGKQLTTTTFSPTTDEQRFDMSEQDVESSTTFWDQDLLVMTTTTDRDEDIIMNSTPEELLISTIFESYFNQDTIPTTTTDMPPSIKSVTDDLESQESTPANIEQIPPVRSSKGFRETFQDILNAIWIF